MKALRLHAPSIVLLCWAAYLLAGQGDHVVVWLTAVAVALFIHAEQERRDHA